MADVHFTSQTGHTNIGRIWTYRNTTLTAQDVSRAAVGGFCHILHRSVRLASPVPVQPPSDPGSDPGRLQRCGGRGRERCYVCTECLRLGGGCVVGKAVKEEIAKPCLFFCFQSFPSSLDQVDLLALPTDCCITWCSPTTHPECKELSTHVRLSYCGWPQLSGLSFRVGCH